MSTITVVTFNMQNGQLWEEANPDATAECMESAECFLQELKPDVLLLQEVERGHDGGHQVEPPPNFERLRRSLPDYHSFFSYPPPNPDELPFGLGLAIFSKFPLQQPRKQILPAADLTFSFEGRQRKPSQRLMLKAEITWQGRRVRLLNTHLQAYFMIDASSNDHRVQRDLVEAELRSSPLPVFLGGDFNSAPDETLVDQFSAAGFPTVQNEIPTWKRRDYVTDHLFYSQDWRVVSHEIVVTRCSDHHAVKAVFEPV